MAQVKATAMPTEVARETTKNPLKVQIFGVVRGQDTRGYAWIVDSSHSIVSLLIASQAERQVFSELR
jgi:hypothetical protein